MDVLSNGKVRRTAAEWQAIFARFERSGLTDRKFCLRESLNLTSFRRWQQRVAPASGDPVSNAERFVDVTPPIGSPAPSTIELEFPDGRVLRIRG